MKTTHKKKKFIILIIILLVVALLMGGLALRHTKNPRIRMLLSILHFTESTLEDPSYLLYDIDIMELCREYLNADTQITGTAGVDHMQKVKSSIYLNMNATRSFVQKRAAAHMDLDFVVMNAGKMNLYGENETVYLDAPLLGDNVGYAFPTGLNLFPKAPDLTSDIDKTWFRQNAKNIVELMQNISIEETGEVIQDKDGTKSQEFVVTIPQGQGDFVWELLGMEAPDYDVVSSIYLTEDNRLRRISMDLSQKVEGASVVLDGTTMGTCYFYYNLPENERLEVSMVRNPQYKNWIDCEMLYITNKEDRYKVTSNITWNREDKGFSLKINDLIMANGDKELARGFFKGQVMPLEEEPDVFEGREDYLYNLQELDWRKIREDSESFINEVLAKTSMSVLME